MIEKVINAIIQTMLECPELEDILQEKLSKYDIVLSKNLPFTFFTCKHIGTSFTTPIYLMENKEHSTWTARAGIAILGSTNMPEEKLKNISPFDREFHDNFAEGKGNSPKEAIQNMEKDMISIAESLWH